MIGLMKQKLILVGPLPPPRHGQSMSFEMLVKELSKQSEVKVVDIADRRNGISNSFLGRVKRITSYVLPLISYLIFVRSSDARVYLTISQSRYGFFRDFIFIRLAALFSCKMVVHLKGGNYHNFYKGENAFVQWLIRTTLMKTERILVLGKNLVHMYDFEPRLQDRLFVVENGLPFDSPGSKPKKLTSPVFRLLFLSNLIETKGYLDILEAVNFLIRDGVRVEAHFAGDFLCNNDDQIVTSVEDAKNRFWGIVSKYNLTDSVKYHGVVFGEKKVSLLKNSDAFILPTKYNNEGQPVSIIEALAFGLPIISTNYRAIPDMLIDGETGCFVEHGSANSIVEAVKKLVNPDIYSEISENCIELYLKKFTREAHIKRIRNPILGNNIASSQDAKSAIE